MDSQLAQAESVESSPPSRLTSDSHEDSQHGPKLRLMCSYGGHIVPRPHDKTLCYVGGDTRIVVTDRHSSLPDLITRLSKTTGSKNFTLKYQLPNEDLDSLISLTGDEDLENMLEEYDRATRPSRLRLFIFPAKPDSPLPPSIASLMDNSTKSDDWFMNALNGVGIVPTESFDCLLDLGSGDLLKKGKHEVHSVPDSPMLETNSSFGSASSSPSLANLPPIRVHADPAPIAPDLKLSQTQTQKQIDLPSPDSVSSDSSLRNAMFPSKPTSVQDPVAQLQPSATIHAASSSPVYNPRPQILQQAQDPGYVFAQSQLNDLQHHNQKQTQAPVNQTQYVHPSPHYIHHVQPGGPVQIPSYYHPVYPSQHHHPQFDHPYVYFMPARPAQQPYNLSITPPPQSNLNEQTAPLPSALPTNPPGLNAPLVLPKPDAYRTGPTGGPQLVQVPPGQFVGYSQMHHSIAPNYEYTDPSHGQVFYASPQYQATLPESGGLQIPSETSKQHVKTSQAL